RDGAGFKPRGGQMSIQTGLSAGFTRPARRHLRFKANSAPGKRQGSAGEPEKQRALRFRVRNLLYHIINSLKPKTRPPGNANAQAEATHHRRRVAIDIHTHAEEPCGMHGDDGYDDFQAQMAEYFKSPHKHPPTVPETAAYYRAKRIAAVIFPVDAER